MGRRRQSHKQLCIDQRARKWVRRKKLSIRNKHSKEICNKATKAELGRSYRSAWKAIVANWFLIERDI